MAIPTSEVAKMGYIGFAKVFDLPVRFTSSNMGLRQDLIPSDMIDGGADRVMYRQSVIEASGDINFPVVIDGGFDFLDTIWEYAVDRKRNTELRNRGELVNRGDVLIRFSQANERGEGGTYIFSKCKVKTLGLSITQGETMTGTLTVWGVNRQRVETFDIPRYTTPNCTVTWAHVNVYGYSPSQPRATSPDPIDKDNTFASTEVRSFSVNIENNLERNYTFNDEVGLALTNLTTGQRDITGTLEFQGWAPVEALAESHSARVGTDEIIELGVRSRLVGGTTFRRRFFGVTYQLQDISSVMGVLAATTNWRAHGIKQFEESVATYRAIDITGV